LTLHAGGGGTDAKQTATLGNEVLPSRAADRKYSVANRFFMKLLKTINIQMVNDCQVYFGFDLPIVIIDRQSKKFLSANVNVS